MQYFHPAVKLKFKNIEVFFLLLIFNFLLITFDIVRLSGYEGRRKRTEAKKIEERDLFCQGNI